MRVCAWDIPRSCVHWKGYFVYFGTYGFGKTVTPSHWEGHADLLQRGQISQIRLLERTVLKLSPVIPSNIGLGPSGYHMRASVNRIVDDTPITTLAHYSESNADLIRSAFHKVCELAGQQRQLTKVVRYSEIVAFDGFLPDLTASQQAVGVPADKCAMITLLINLAPKCRITPDEALSLIGKFEHIAGVISTTSPLIPAFRVSTLAATHNSLHRVNLSPDATADLRRWHHLLNIRLNGGAIWTPLSSPFLVSEPTLRIQTDASGDQNLGVGGFAFVNGKPAFAFAYSWQDLYGDAVDRLFDESVYPAAYIELVGLYIGLQLAAKHSLVHPLTARWVTDSEAGSKAWSNRRSPVLALNYLLKDIGFVLAAHAGVCISTWASRNYRNSQLADSLSRLDRDSFLQGRPEFTEILPADPSQTIRSGLRKQISRST